MLLGEQRWREDLSFAKAVNEGASHTSPRQPPVCSSNKAQRSSESARPPDPHPAALHSRNLPRQGRRGEQWHGFCSWGLRGPSRALCGHKGGARSGVMNHRDAGFRGERETKKRESFQKSVSLGEMDPLA